MGSHQGLRLEHLEFRSGHTTYVAFGHRSDETSCSCCYHPSLSLRKPVSSFAFPSCPTRCGLPKIVSDWGVALSANGKSAQAKKLCSNILKPPRLRLPLSNRVPHSAIYHRTGHAGRVKPCFRSNGAPVNPKCHGSKCARIVKG